jgi:hypothetical protein
LSAVSLIPAPTDVTVIGRHPRSEVIPIRP